MSGQFAVEQLLAMFVNQCAVFRDKRDLSKEVVGLNFILWLIAVSALPLILIWNNRCRYTLLRQLRTPGQRIRSLAYRTRT